MAFGQYLVEILTVCVCDEYLTERVARHDVDNLFHALGVKFVKDIVKQQQRRGLAACALKEIKLRQFERNHICLVLSLRAFALDGISFERHLKVIFVHAM